MGCGLPIAGLLLLAIVYVNRNRTPDIVVPTHSVPANNAYNDFARAGQLAKGMLHPSIYSLPTANGALPGVAYMALSAKDSGPALALLNNALDKPYSTPPIRTSNDPGFQNYAKMRELARTAAGTAKYYTQIGQNRRAADILLDGYEMGVIMPKDGVLITGLVGVAIQSICAKPLDPLLAKLSPADLAHVAKRLDKIADKQVSFADIIAEEGNASTAMYLEFMRSPASRGLGGLNALTGGQGMADGESPRFQDLLQGARYAMSDKTAILHENQKYFQAIAVEARRPYTGSFQTPFPNNVIAQVLMPVFSQARTRFVVGEAVLALLRLETGLYRYHAATGHFPPSLAILASEKDGQGIPYLRIIPTDPFGGKPLHYSLTEGGKSFLLYSIGPNLQDDHGVPQQSPGDNKGGDIVAGKMWRPRLAPNLKLPLKAGPSPNPASR